MFELFRAEFMRSFILMRRYFSNTVGGIVGLTVVFMGLFLGSRYMSGTSAFGDRLESVVVGYVLWALILFILSDISSDTHQEAQTGTLEQVCLSPFGLTRVFVVRSFSSVIWMLINNTVILTLIVLLTRVSLHISVWVAFPVLTTVLAAYGLAFLLGALSLGAKKIQQLIGLLNFGLLFLMMTPFEQTLPALKNLVSLLPLVPSAMGLRTVMVHGAVPAPEHLALMLANGLFWFAVGVWTFNKADHRVRQRGVLSSY